MGKYAIVHKTIGEQIAPKLNIKPAFYGQFRHKNAGFYITDSPIRHILALYAHYLWVFICQYAALILSLQKKTTKRVS